MTDQYRESDYDAGISGSGAIDPHAARHAAEVLRKQDFYTNEGGGFVGAPTNLTVDANGLVHDATGEIVGRAGEVFVDANGNAINAQGQIVGQATRPISAILHDARTGMAKTATTYLPTTPSAHPEIPNQVIPNPISEVQMSDERVPATYAAPTYQNEAAREAEAEFVGVGTGGADEYADDPRNKYRDGIDGVAQNRFGDGVYGDGNTFASRAFGQNRDTEMLEHDTPERPLDLFGRNDVGDAGEIPNAADAAAEYGQ